MSSKLSHLALVTMPEADDLALHEGHELGVASWGRDGEVWNIAVVCEDCQAIVLDYDAAAAMSSN